MVVGIIGILAAVAIPAYNSYQNNAKAGVVSSILELVARTVKIEESLGNSPSETLVWNKIESKDKDNFTEAFTYTGSKDWCFKITATSGNYDGFNGCVDGGNIPLIGGSKVEISCSEAKVRTAKAGSTGVPPIIAITCPTGCKSPTPAPPAGGTAACEPTSTNTNGTFTEAPECKSDNTCSY